MSVTVDTGVVGDAPLNYPANKAANTTRPVSLTVNLAKQGGDVWFPIAQSVELSPGNATLTVSCPSDGGTCIADAVLVESKARYNDGSAIASTGNGGGVLLRAMDAIILARTNPPAHCGSSKVSA